MLNLDPSTTALILVDFQAGILSRALAPHTAPEILAGALRLGTAMAAAGSTLVLVNVAFAADRADALQQPVDAPMPMPPGGLPPGWSDIVPEIAALPARVRVTKRQWGAFHGTELDLQLRRRGITSVAICGIATNFGVESTAREAWQHGYAVVIAEDACTSVSKEMHAFAVQSIFPRIARVASVEAIVEALVHPG